MWLHQASRIVASATAVGFLLSVGVGTAAPAAPDSNSVGGPSSVYSAEGGVAPKGPGEIADCLANPSMPPETQVDFYDSLTPDRSDVYLFCGNVEVYGARHVHAGHPINNPINFRYCVMGGLSGSKGPGSSPDSTAWTYEYRPGQAVTVITDNFDRDVITAHTSGPNSADWDGCAEALPPALLAAWSAR
jgi:hypothetical protein